MISAGIMVYGINEATFYNLAADSAGWKAKYRGIAVSELNRMKVMEDENSRFKRIVANLTLENDAI